MVHLAHAASQQQQLGLLYRAVAHLGPDAAAVGLDLLLTRQVAQAWWHPVDQHITISVCLC